MNKILRAASHSLVLCALSLVPASADRLILANGNELDGIVLWQDESRLEFQFAHAGSITFGREEVEQVLYSDSAGRDGIRAVWADGYTHFLADLKAQEDFDKKQRDRGLVRDGGEWVSEKEYTLRTEREAAIASAAKAADEETPAKKEPVQVVVVTTDYSRPIAAPAIVSYPVVDALGRPQGYVVRNDQIRGRNRHRSLGNKTPEKQVPDWKGETAADKEIRRISGTIWSRMSTGSL